MTGYTRTVRVRGIIPFENAFLFVKHKFDPTFWALPGGGLEEHETLKHGLERELVEELGVKPDIGMLLYVQQLFIGSDNESLEFFFEVTNGAEYQQIDLQKTTHGAIELTRADFIDPASTYILPEFLAKLAHDKVANVWPKVFVRTSEKL
jgi:ADP-ribose pyrophosphatase YjhB (NUDIX family)